MDTTPLYICDCKCTSCSNTVNHLLNKMTELENIYNKRLRTKEEHFDALLTSAQDAFTVALDCRYVDKEKIESECRNKYINEITALKNDNRVAKEKSDSIYRTYKDNAKKLDKIMTENYTNKKLVIDANTLNRQLRLDNNTYKDKVADLELSILQQRKTITALENQVTRDIGVTQKQQTKKKIELLEKAMDEKDDTILQLKLDINQMQRKLNKHENDHNNIVNEHESTINKLRAELVDAKQKNVKAEEENTRLSTVLDQQIKELDIWKRNMRVQTEKIKKLS